MSRGAFDLGDNLGFSASGKTVFETPRVLVKSRRETGNFWIEILWSGYFFLFFFPPSEKSKSGWAKKNLNKIASGTKSILFRLTMTQSSFPRFSSSNCLIRSFYLFVCSCFSLRTSVIFLIRTSYRYRFCSLNFNQYSETCMKGDLFVWNYLWYRLLYN